MAPPGSLWGAPPAAPLRAAGTFALKPFTAAGAVSWAPAIVSHWGPRLGGCADARLVIDLLCRSLRPTSSGSYGSKWRRFAAFCESKGLTALPAAPSTVLLYLGHLASEGRVQAANLQPYFSAINKLHVDLELPPPARGTSLSAARRRLALAQREVAERTQRLPLPAGVALAVLWCGLHTPDDHVLRCCVCLVINFMFGCRPATGAAMRAGDLFLAVGSFCLRLETEKQRSLEMERRVLRVPAEFIAGPLALWQRWVARREALAFPIAGRARVWGLTPSSPVRARDLDLWFRDAVAATSFVAPPGFEVTGYAARRGMATAAASINAHMEMIKYVGGWAVDSQAVYSYIDMGVRPCAAAFLWFRWFLKDNLAPPPSLQDWLDAARAAAASIHVSDSASASD